MFLGREIYKRNKIFMDDKRRMQEASDYLKSQRLNYDITKKMRELSIAEAQMIEIIKAISINAKIILMDEPTSSLTEKEVDFLMKKIFELKAQGITIIYISHKLDEVFRIADYISVFRDGQHIVTDRASAFSRPILIEKMVGREMKSVFPPRTSRPDGILMEVKNFNRKGMFKDISFFVRKGEILGVTGLVGAGRSEIARSVIGLDPKDSGEVFCEGRKLHIRDINDTIREGILMVTEDRKRYGLILSRDIKENISLVALKHLFKKKVVPLRKEKEVAKRMIKRFAIKAPSMSTITQTLSGGNQQKVVLAKLMALNPKVLIMDEPTRGIDVGTKYEIYKIMNELTDQGMGIILIDSDMEELLGMSDRVMVVKEGCIAGILEKDEISPEKIMSYAVGG